MSLRSGIAYDSNVRNSATNKEGATDGSAAVILALASNQRDDFTWRLRYQPRYRVYPKDSSLNYWLHNVRGDLHYAWSPATSFNSTLGYDRNERNIASPTVSVDPTLPVVSGDNLVERFHVGGAAAHQFTSRWGASLSLSQSVVRFTQESASDSDTTGVSTALNYSLSRRQVVGGGLTITDQSTQDRIVTGNAIVVGDANGNPSLPAQGVSCDLSGLPPIPPGGAIRARVTCDVPGQNTQFFQLFGRWSLALSPRWRFSLQAGPTHIRPSTGAASTTLFANLALSHHARRSDWSFAFSRSESGAFGSATSTVANIFRTNWRWKPSEYWQLNLAGSYSLRQSVLQNDNRTISVYSVIARASRRLTRKLSGVMVMSYRMQQDNQTFSASSGNISGFETSIGLQYDFDPVLF